MMHALMVMLVVSGSGSVHAAPAAVPDADLIAASVEMYRDFATMRALSQAGPLSSPEDQAYVATILKPTDLALPPPHLTVQGDVIQIERFGLRIAPLLSQPGRFLINGQEWTLPVDESLQVVVESLQAIMSRKPTALERLHDLAVPQAHAVAPHVVAALATAYFVGVVRYANACREKSWSCTLSSVGWPVTALARLAKRLKPFKIESFEPEITRMSDFSCPPTDANGRLVGSGQAVRIAGERLQFDFVNGYVARIRIVENGAVTASTDVYFNDRGKVDRATPFKDPSGRAVPGLYRDLVPQIPHVATAIQQVCSRPDLRARMQTQRTPHGRSGSSDPSETGSGR